MFRPVESSVSFPEQEEEVLRFWTKERIYEKSLEARAGAPSFVFYEGPPTANGLPHPGHCLTRAIKDLFPRYRTMRGYLCKRKGGWDTHGLPVEVEVCKELGIHSKEEIEKYGIEPFIHRCLQSVFRYTKEWEELTERLGFWIRLDEAYVTYHQSYVQSVWWALKNLFDRGLLYQGHKIVWWWAQGGTALSSGEVGQGYREVADPSVYVRFPLVDQPDTSLLVWTTTPWTLPSNQFVAVDPELEYVEVDLFRDRSASSSQSKSGSKSQSQSRSGSTSASASWSGTGSGAYRRSLRGNEERTRVVVAKELLHTLANKFDLVAYQVKATRKGEDLVGWRYVPPFDYYYKKRDARTGTPMGNLTGELMSGGKQHIAWRVVPADFVTIDTGTGVVHLAPAFGEVDYDVLLREQKRFRPYYKSDVPPDAVGTVEVPPAPRPKLINSVAPDGTFTHETPEYQSRWVKEADADICRELKARGVLFYQEQYVHDYPFCWRAEEDPLIQYPRRSWFIRTTQFKEKMLANNARINWLPGHIRDGRFGNFLQTNVDWALSRERYWGTPLPIWVCQKTGYMEAVASYEELLAKPGVRGTDVWEKAKKANPELPDDLKVHKPYIDAITYDSPQAKGARMQRVPEVIDCWFDSGAMPFAQWGYPGQAGSEERFLEQFPADFISEALDQTRGWFYSLLAISTLLFSEEFPHPYRNCIVLGLMLSEWWEAGKQVFLSEDDARKEAGGKYHHRVGKMSKQLRNYRAPQEIFTAYGADALRWYFFANQAPWNSIIYSEKAIRENIPEFLLRLWNVYSFFVIYANIDGFDPAAGIGGDAGQLGPEVLAGAQGYRPLGERGELDRWVLSELNRTAAAVVERMDAYDNYGACTHLAAFLDALSNWYVRRSRDRFWTGQRSADKTDAHWTLYECLVTTCKLIAPFVPFVSEAIWQNLAVAALGNRVLESVHLCDYPTGQAEAVDEELSARMTLAREIVSLGRAARMGAKLKVRQPLERVEVVLADTAHVAWLEEHAALVREELNVKQVEYIQKADQYISYTVLPDLKRLGPRLGKRLPALRKLLATADAAKLLAEMESAGKVTLALPDGPVELDSDDLQVRMQAKPGWAAAQGRACVVVLSTELTDDLVAEGLAREVVHAVQNRRKDIGCEYTDRIVIGVVTESEELLAAIGQFRDYIMHETLAVDVLFEAIPGAERVDLALAGHAVAVYIRVVEAASP